MTLKDLSLEIDNLKLANVEKDDLIKVLDEKLISLQSWMQQMYSTLSNKMNETDQHHYKNEKILENKITELQDKITRLKRSKKLMLQMSPQKTHLYLAGRNNLNKSNVRNVVFLLQDCAF